MRDEFQVILGANMTRGRLTEKYVKGVAVRWLASYYEQKHDIQGVVFDIEAGVKKVNNLGNGRADGLIIAQSKDGTILVASLEAKSSKTFFNLSPWYKDEKWLLHAIFAGVIGFTIALFAGLSIEGWFWVWVFPLLAFIIVGFTYLIITCDYHYYRQIDVMSQVKRYPANERWIALSTDVFNEIGQKQRTLRKDCQRAGIGLVRVSAGEKITLLEKPKSQKLPRGYEDFLSCYAKEKILRKKLWAKLEDVPTLAQNSDEVTF